MASISASTLGDTLRLTRADQVRQRAGLVRNAHSESQDASGQLGLDRRGEEAVSRLNSGCAAQGFHNTNTGHCPDHVFVFAALQRAGGVYEAPAGLQILQTSFQERCLTAV